MSPAGTGYGAKKSTLSVAQTCNQLSLFLKDKGGNCLKDVHFGIDSSTFHHPSSAATTMDLLSNMETQNTYDHESKSKQMTIFYNGQVMVVDDISEATAKEVMLAAAAAADYDDNNSSATSTKGKGKAAAAIENSGSNQRPRIDVQLQPNGLDLPIARRASLHKFLSKRRDRATVRPEPYQLHHHHKNNNDHKFDLNL